jgi:alpha-galactosidase
MLSSLVLLTAAITHASASPPLKVIKYGTTPNGFHAPARGWNSFGIQANGNTAPDFSFDQSHVQAQCDVLASKLHSGGYTYCSLDSGWSEGSNGDEYGRLIPDKTRFPDLPGFATHLHGQGLKLGVYVVPGGFRADTEKTIFGTNTKIGSACSGDNGLARCNWNYSHPDTQKWFNSVATQFASW